MAASELDDPTAPNDEGRWAPRMSCAATVGSSCAVWAFSDSHAHELLPVNAKSSIHVPTRGQHHDGRGFSEVSPSGTEIFIGSSARVHSRSVCQPRSNPDRKRTIAISSLPSFSSFACSSSRCCCHPISVEFWPQPIHGEVERAINYRSRESRVICDIRLLRFAPSTCKYISSALQSITRHMN